MSDNNVGHSVTLSDDELQLIVHGLMDLGEKAKGVGREFDDILELVTRLAPFLPK